MTYVIERVLETNCKKTKTGHRLKMLFEVRTGKSDTPTYEVHIQTEETKEVKPADSLEDAKKIYKNE